MGELNIDNSVAGSNSGFTDFSVTPQQTDAHSEQKETSFQQTNWSQWLGYYKEIPELNSTIDARATWTIGKGFKADEITTMNLDTITGNGADTFNTILENMIRTMWIGGDSYAEIVRDEAGVLLNLKTLDMGQIRIVANNKGLIIRYELASKTPNGKVQKFQPDEIFHLSRNRVADEIHGVSVIEKLEQIILMRNEAMEDYKQVMHFNVKPRWIFHLDTDNEAKIAKFKAMQDAANAKGQNMYIPKGAVVPELMAVSANSTLSPLAWIDSLNDSFYEACATPKIIVGNSKNFTEASAKIVYLAFQQSVEEDQLFIEQQILLQLNLEIDLEFPASLENELLSDNKKDGNTANQPSDTTAGVGQ